MIIVEGPDNAGKTTLITNLSADFGLRIAKSLRAGPPVNSEDLYERSKYTIDQALECISKRFIVDRMSLIGESIYGPICRGKDLWVDIYEKKLNLLSVVYTINPFYIYCRPPIPILQDFSSHNVKSYDTEEHIKRIKEQSSLIIKGYDTYFNNINPYNFFKYDYTNKESYKKLTERLKEYLK